MLEPDLFGWLANNCFHVYIVLFIIGLAVLLYLTQNIISDAQLSYPVSHSQSILSAEKSLSNFKSNDSMKSSKESITCRKSVTVYDNRESHNDDKQSDKSSSSESVYFKPAVEVDSDKSLSEKSDQDLPKEDFSVFRRKSQGSSDYEGQFHTPPFSRTRQECMNYDSPSQNFPNPGDASDNVFVRPDSPGLNQEHKFLETGDEKNAEANELRDRIPQTAPRRRRKSTLQKISSRPGRKSTQQSEDITRDVTEYSVSTDHEPSAINCNLRTLSSSSDPLRSRIVTCKRQLLPEVPGRCCAFPSEHTSDVPYTVLDESPEPAHNENEEFTLKKESYCVFRNNQLCEIPYTVLDESPNTQKEEITVANHSLYEFNDIPKSSEVCPLCHNVVQRQQLTRGFTFTEVKLKSGYIQPQMRRFQSL